MTEQTPEPDDARRKAEETRQERITRAAAALQLAVAAKQARPKPPRFIEVDLPTGPVKMREDAWQGWVEKGLSQLDASLARHAEFDAFLRETGRI